MEPRLRASPKEFSLLIEFMERYGDPGRPQLGIQGRIKAESLWLELGRKLNSIDGGVHKSFEKWKKRSSPNQEGGFAVEIELTQSEYIDLPTSSIVPMPPSPHERNSQTSPTPPFTCKSSPSPLPPLPPLLPLLPQPQSLKRP